MPIVLFLVQILILFFVSQMLTKILSRLFYHLFKSQKIVIQLLSFLFLPGVVVHELSHLLTASMLMVPTGEVEFLPEVHGNEVKMGSVAIAKTDPFRRFLIGVAPLILGLSMLFIFFWYFYPLKSLLSYPTALLFYVIFEVGNTMFSSRKDMEGALGFGIAVGFLILVGFFAGIRLPASFFQFFLEQPLLHVVSLVNIFLFLGIVLDGFVIILCYSYLHWKTSYYR